MAGLRLEVREFVDLTWWRLVLIDETSGNTVADHEVRLDFKCWQYEAFTDLLGYLSWHAAPDRRAEDEARIVSDLGVWIGSQVLGPVADTLVKRRPATVRVLVHQDAGDAKGTAAGLKAAGAQALLFRPLELAHVNGKPLAAQDITLVMQPAADDDGSGGSAAVAERLRVLGLFSLPDGGQPLNLRRERQSLVRLILGIAATGKAVDVRVLQYGVTRDRLRAILGQAEGWDIVHISGHGMPGELLLETSAGQPDPVSAADLADMLSLACDRIKLVTLAACWSAALITGEQRRFLGLPVPDQGNASERAGGPRDTGSPSGALATELVGRLGCAVLAMRYPVGDEFAIALAGKLYDLLADKGHPLPRATGMALLQLSAQAFPVLSIATPALFGGTAVELGLAAPVRGRPQEWLPGRDYGTAELKMAGWFPPQPERFVGRTGVMACASAALADESGVPGVLLHGMPGGGKTACAAELAYTHEHAFDRLIWYKAPDDGMEIAGALTDFALTMERYLDGLQMAHLLASQDMLTGFLPRLTEMMQQRRLLVVIDNAESLLTESGQWRDDRWERVISALCGHTGPGRLVLTSRRVPVGLTLPEAPDTGALSAEAVPASATSAGTVSAGPVRLRVEAVGALSADEALLLARELPHLHALSRGAVPGIERHVARRLARRALDVAQGHPKLLELAEGQAADPKRLARLVNAGDEAWAEHGGLPDGFFAIGDATSAASAGDYLHVLATWTSAVTGALAPGERDLFWFLSCLEEGDRERAILEDTWADMWAALGRGGQPPGLSQALSALAAQGLVATQAGMDTKDESYAVHPGVASTGRTRAGKPFQDTVDAQAVKFWVAVYLHASGEAGDGGVHTGMLMRAGLSVVPYLIRQQQWALAAGIMESVFIRDQSQSNAAAMLPTLQQIIGHDPAQAGVLARVLEAIDPIAAEAQLRAARDAAVTRGDYRGASAITGVLVELCRDAGRLAEALTLAEQMADYARQAGLGPWSQLSDEVHRLQVLIRMGRGSQVLAEVQQFLGHMRTLPAAPGPGEAVPPWGVREALLDVGGHAARQLGRWQDALTFSAEIIASMRDRHATTSEITQARFNDYGPLISLDRTDEALDLLLDCRQAFQDARDIQGLGMTLGAIANIEAKRGHGDAAIRLQRDALRFDYLAGDVSVTAGGYHNLGGWLLILARQPIQALASHLAAALIYALIDVHGTGPGTTEGSLHDAAVDLQTLGADATPPTSMDDLDDQLGDIPGTDLPRLIATLSPDPETAERTLRDLIAQAQSLAATSS